MLCLTHRALDGARGLDVNVGLDACYRNEAVVKMLDERHLLGGVGREEVFAEFHIKVEGVFIMLTVHRNEVLRCERRELCVPLTVISSLSTV